MADVSSSEAGATLAPHVLIVKKGDACGERT
jgi:hypothetical protein